MLFNSYEFLLLFVPLTLLGYYSLAARGLISLALGWLVFASLVFYGWWNPVYLALITASTLFNFMIGHHIARMAADNHARRRRMLLIVGVAANLGALGYFKYANFLADTVSSLTPFEIQLTHIVLPLAISFFTFQQITYLVDTYKGEPAEPSLLRYSLFVTFFPQLIAGPIVHHKEMLPQFAEEGRLHHHLAASGNFGQIIRKNYPVVSVECRETAETVTVVGPLCTPLDLLGDCVNISRVEAGSLIAILQSGAYGKTASPERFLSHPPSNELFV